MSTTLRGKTEKTSSAGKATTSSRTGTDRNSLQFTLHDPCTFYCSCGERERKRRG